MNDISPEVLKSSEVSWISNFGESRIPKNCPDYQKLTELAKKIKKVNIEEAGNILQVIMSSHFNEDQEILIKSADQYGLPYVMIGLCQEWRGLGDKILRVRDMLRLMSTGEAKELGITQSKYNDLYIQFTDAWDVLIVNHPKKLESTYISQFPKNAIVFMGETACWPDESLMSSYPDGPTEFKYLNSGVFFAPAPRLLYLYEDFPIESFDYDDQLYYTHALFQNDYGLVIDYKKQMFGSLHGYVNFDDIFLVQTNLNGDYRLESKVYLRKTKDYFNSFPAVVHGHGPIGGPSKHNLRMLQNFFPSTKASKAPYLALPPLPSTESNGKKILLALYLFSDSRFFNLFIDGVTSLNHKKQDMVLWINYVKVNDTSNPNVENWIKSAGNLGYSKVIVNYENDIRKAKMTAMKSTVANNCDYYFTTDSLLENKDLISLLVAEDKTIVAPMIKAHNSLYSNFWGAYHFDSGSYKRHPLYKLIANHEARGVFGVNVIWGTFLVKASYSEEFSQYYLSDFKTNSKPLQQMNVRADQNVWWCDVYFSAKLAVDRPVYLVNRDHYGHLIDHDPIDDISTRLHKDLYTYNDHKYLWKKNYYSEEFFNFIFKKTPLNYTEECRDVFVWRFFKPIFGQHLFEEAEHFGQWSNGGHKQQVDPRIGGVENYPTQDIHLNQFGLHDIWLDIITTDIAEFASHVYEGVTTKGINIAFIVRYKPGAQSFLRPHHDSSLYTVAVALNKPGADFEGGGVRFVRHNCTYIPPDSGFSLIHPGRVTHRHEGLRTTKGTRYIFVTFVD